MAEVKERFLLVFVFPTHMEWFLSGRNGKWASDNQSVVLSYLILSQPLRTWHLSPDKQLTQREAADLLGRDLSVVN